MTDTRTMQGFHQVPITDDGVSEAFTNLMVELKSLPGGEDRFAILVTGTPNESGEEGLHGYTMGMLTNTYPAAVLEVLESLVSDLKQQVGFAKGN